MRDRAISVAMATYNGERFLQEQLDSLGRQTLLPCELVACDDGSTDGTLDILRAFAVTAPFPVRIFVNDMRLGYCDNFLRAVELCEGELIAFCDQDDLWLPEKLAACTDSFETEQVSMVIHLAMLVNSNMVPLNRVWPHLGRFGGLPSEVPLLASMDVVGMTMVFRRDAARPLSHHPELRRALSAALLGHDPIMRLLAGASGSVVPLRKVLALHRCHNTNTSNAHVVSSASAPAYIWGAKGLRRRLVAAARWIKTHARLASAVDWNSYRKEAELLWSKAELLGNAALYTDGRLRAVLQRTIAILSRRARALAERSHLYQTASGRALPVFSRMVVRGLYRSRSRGGLGLWSLVKDFLITVRFFRRRVAKLDREASSRDRLLGSTATEEQ